MAVRDALLRVTPKSRKAAEPTPGSDSGRAGLDKAAAGKGGSGRDASKSRTPKARSAKERTPRARAPKEAKGRAPKGTRTAKEAPAVPRTPVLQRRSLGPTLARAAVMALALVGMVAFAVALAKVTLVPSPASVHLIHTNLRPGASIRAYLDQPALRDTVKQIGGNILLGVPFGILLPMLFPNARGLVRVLLLTALVMVMVETAQGLIVEGRAFDIDDVILNTTGALLGYLLLGRRLGRALHPRRTHWWHRLGFGDAPAERGAGAETTTGPRIGTGSRTAAGTGTAGSGKSGSGTSSSGASGTSGTSGTGRRAAVRPGRRPARKRP